MRINLPDVTICMHIRIDSPARLENALIVINYLTKVTDAKIIVMEADSILRGKVLSKRKDISYIYIQDKDPVFHLTSYRNELIRRSATPIVALWDVDVVANPVQLCEAIERIRRKEAVLAWPYDGICYNVPREITGLFGANGDIKVLTSRKHNFLPMFGALNTGGIFFADKEQYMEIGMDNEYMHGWGLEDIERLKRITILGLPVYRVRGDLYHLWHPRGKNSGYADKQREMEVFKEYLKVCSYSRDELLNYIKTWE